MENKKVHTLLDKFYRGQTTEEENKKLGSLSSRELEREFNEYSDNIWTESDSAEDTETIDRMRDAVLCRIAAVDDLSKRNTRRMVLNLCKVAAMVAVVAGAVWAGYSYADASRDTQLFEVVADRGQKSSVTLPDGSRIWLNSASKITYSSEFNIADRTISLDGEAYFEVAHNEELPFVVTANEMQVTALGTKFNVKAYTNEDDIVATLVEGKILTRAGESSEIITPNNQSCYNRSSGRLTVQRVTYSDHPIPWHNNELIFDGETLGEIAACLERMYNVEIIFSDESVMKFTYRGLVRNNSLHNVLYLISSTSPVKYQIYGNTVKFSRRN